MPHRIVATHTPFVIIRALPSMKKLGLPLLAAFVLCLAAPALPAQSDDPSETFLKAYMTSQQGEKLEHENQFKAALAKYRFAGTLLEQLRKAHPDWQPAIVEYRGRKVSESILRVQDKASTQENVSAPAENVAAAPQDSQPPVQVAQEAIKSEIAQLKKALVSAQQGRSAAEKERDDANAKVTAADQQRASAGKERDEANARAAEADQKVASANKERDDAVARLKGLKDTEQRVGVLVAENSDLKQKLADAEKTVREISADKPKKEKELADVKKQIGDLQAQLAASQTQNQTYETTVAQLRSQLDEASKPLEQVKLVGATPEETATLTKENEMLRNIIVRERQEEARRDQAKKLMLAEFDKLQIKSETLTQQIQLLAQPVTRLTTDALALLRQPVVSISDDNPSAVKASFTFAKRTKTNTPTASTYAPADSLVASKAPSAPAGQTGYTVPSIFNPNVPQYVFDLARPPKANFLKCKYQSAEKIYQEILTKTPHNLYSLSNLGVVYFRSGKLKAAELTLKKTVALSPKDEFTHTTLRIAY